MLNGLREFSIGRRDGNGGRIATAHFPRERRAAEGADARAKPLDDTCDDFRHSHVAPIFQALCRAHQQHFRRQMWQDFLVDAATMVGGHRTDHNVGFLQSIPEAAGRRDTCGYCESRQIECIFPLSGYGGADFGLKRPEANRMPPVAGENNSEGCAPRTRAEDCNPAHACTFICAPTKIDSPAPFLTGQCCRCDARE